MKVIGKGPERPNRFFVTIWTDGSDVDCRAYIDRRRGRVDPGQISGFMRPLRLRHSVTLLPEKAKEGLGHGERSIS
jgi:hypothetical protein